MGIVKDTPGDASIPEDEEIPFDDKCNSCPPSYDLTRGGASNGGYQRSSLARTNSSNSVSSLQTSGARQPPITRSASSASFNIEKMKQRGLSRSMSTTSFNMPGTGERSMSRSMSSASFFFSGEEYEGT